VSRPPWQSFREALDAAGFRPSKTLGQNFLLDGNMARSLVRDAGVEPGDRVLEIGAGCGFLTVHLAGAGAEVLAIEIDPRLCAVASAFLAGEPRVRLLQADALAGKHALAPELEAALPAAGPWKVVSNLPYAIAGPLLVLLTRLPHPPASLSVLVQREVAEKVAAEPGSSGFGALSARLALDHDRRAGRIVPAGLFWPRPRVESRVVHLDRRPGPAPDPARRARYDRLVERVFQQRRKTVLATLSGPAGGRARAQELLAAAGVPAGARPENLTPEVLLALADSLGGG
jgi:16S rRNA (adenine1518-N6/adenine1519-N6)-dimethyltransferase